MAGLGDVSITFDIEPVVKLLCFATNCRFNAMNFVPPRDKGITCELKHIEINSHNACNMYERRKCDESA